MGDDRKVLAHLLGEDVNTEVTGLASLGRSSYANNLARAVLKDNEITNADEMVGDGQGVATLRSEASRRWSRAGGATTLVNVNILLKGSVAMMTTTVDGVENAVSGLVKSVTDAVVATLVVVVTHLGFFGSGGGAG
jgi:hypothetical protein